MGHWQWQHRPPGPAARVGMLASTVSSKMLQKIAGDEGFLFEETLTGFKWMGNRCVVAVQRAGAGALVVVVVLLLLLVVLLLVCCCCCCCCWQVLPLVLSLLLLVK